MEVVSYEQNDPSLCTILGGLTCLVEGHKIIYEREVPIEVRIMDPSILNMVGQDVKSKE